MPEKPRGVIEKSIGDAEVAAGFSPRSMSDLDKLIADAENAATEALRAGAAEELKTVSKKKKVSAESAGRAEQLQQWFSALKADDAFVEDYGYEWVLKAVEAETSIASPEKTSELIGALRKSGVALRKLGTVEPKSDALLDKMAELQQLHDSLFEQVQTLTTDALDAVKKKYKGEETDFERRYKEMTQSPLVRGVEFDLHSPEAREKALRQEITELLIGHLVNDRLQAVEQEISKQTKLLIAEENKRGHSGLIWQEVQNIDSNINRLQFGIDKLKVDLSRQRLAFEVNRLVIEESMKDEYTEQELTDGLVELKRYLEFLRHLLHQEQTWQSFEKPDTAPKSKFAQNILDQFIQHAVPMPGSEYYRNKQDTKGDTLFPAEQIVGLKASRKNVRRYLYSENYLMGQSYRDLLKRHLGEVDGEEIFKQRILSQGQNFSVDFVKSLYPHSLSPESLEKFPTAEALINEIFGGQGKMFNVSRAYAKIDQGLQGKEETRKNPMPNQLIDAGWKESKLGAFVEPEQNVRAVDREYAQVLERFSQPQVEAERAFDVRGPEGEFHVYTIGQAVDLLRRARRDARDIVLNTERETSQMRASIEGDKTALELRRQTVTAHESDMTKRLQLEQQNAVDQARQAARQAAQQEAQQEAQQRLTAEISRLERIQAEKVRQAILDGDAKLQAQTEQSQEVLRGVLVKLKDALRQKAGLFGGEKDLRHTLEELVRQMEGK